LKHDDKKILAVTFTKKAAGEMQERLRGLLLEEDETGDPAEVMITDNKSDLVQEAAVEMPNGLDRVTLGTFHSVCAKILRWNGKELVKLPSVQREMLGSRNMTNLDGTFAILDQNDQLRIVKEIMKLIGVDLQREKDLKPLTILTAVGKIKAGQVNDRDIGKNRVLSIARDVYPLYRQQLFASNALDFDDLIDMTRELLEQNQTIRELLQRRWPHVLVDEFQDTSKVQLELVKLWTSSSLLVVGDADQSIYSWRGAHVESMMDFEKVFRDVHTVYLMENYRSTTNIVKAAQKVISSSDNVIAADLRQDMKPMRGKGPTPRVLACANGKAEAAYVVKTILGMISENEIRNDQSVAILYRTNAQSRALEEACVQNNLPYVVRGSAGTFYNRAEIKDCLCFLRWLHNGRDQSAMLRAFKTPSKGLGGKSAEEFISYCQAVDEKYAELGVDEKPSNLDLLIAMSDRKIQIIAEAPAPELFLSTRAMNRFNMFAQEMHAIRNKSHRESLSELIGSIIETLRLRDHFDSISKSANEFADRWDNVQELRQAAEKYSNGGAALLSNAGVEESPLSNFLDDVALVTDMAEEGEPRDHSEKAVKTNLMTIHASKGMEFDTVFIVGNEDGTFPTSQAIQEGEGSVALDEERRLCYVAMTRARNYLILTWRKEVSFFQGEDFRTVERDRSRFLEVLVSKKQKDGGSKSSEMVHETSRVHETSGSGSKAFSTSSEAKAKLKKDSSELCDLSKRFDARMKRQKSFQSSASSSERTKQIPAVKAVLPQSEPSRRGSAELHKAFTRQSVASPESSYQRTRPRVKEDAKADSTWFFPVGSSVVHIEHGPGIVLPPPPDVNGEMIVRVKFKGGREVNLPAMGRDLFPN
jgi:DNA helicase-2/ATP-dependent DNA helicase PcrA